MTAPSDDSWRAWAASLDALAGRQLFFVGGAPRSGTTWLQQLLDSHPDVSCEGEGLFWKTLAEPLAALVTQRRQALEAKNREIFRHTGGYKLPGPEDAEVLLGTGILLALRRQAMGRQAAGKACRAVGEKTPENVFMFARLQRLFPGAKFIAIARDPRDVLTSAWHFFVNARPPGEEVAAKTAFIRGALPSLAEGARAMLAFAERHPDAYRLVTYERLHADPAPLLGELFRLLGVADTPDLVAACLRRTAFPAQTGGRPPGSARNGAFLRRGVVGDWPSTLTPEMNRMILDALGWMFPHFGWQP